MARAATTGRIARLVLLRAALLHAAGIAGSSAVQPCSCLDCDCAAVLQPAAVRAHAIVEDEDPDQCSIVWASNFDRRLELFSLGDDGQAYHKAQHADGAGWGSWAVLANTPPHDGGLAVVRAADRLVTAVCGTEGSIHLAAQAEPNGATGRWTAWRPVGGPPGGCKHTPSLVLGGAAALHIFAADAPGRQLWSSTWPWSGGACDYRQLFLGTYEAHVAAGCGPWERLGGETTGAASTVLLAGRLHLFVRGPGGTLFQRAQRPVEMETDAAGSGGGGGGGGGWGNWTALAGAASSTPRLPALTGGVGLARLFFLGTDHAVHQLRQLPEAAGTAWSAAEPLGGFVASAPAAGLNIDGLAQLVALGPDRTVWHRRQLFDATTLLTSWSPWGSLGGETSSGPTVATRSDGLLDVIVRGADRNLYRKPQRFVAADNASTSNQLLWGSWEFLGGPVRNFPC